MLMQNFKSAADLGITEPQKEALMKTLVLLELDRLKHVPDSYRHFVTGTGNYTGHFNMTSWNAETSCGTICCIGGTAELLGGEGLGANNYRKNPNLHDLFLPRVGDWSAITPTQAAIALRSYLTTGDAKWHEAVS